MTTYTAHIEPLTAVLRVFASGRQYGDQYELSVTLRWHSIGVAEIVGLDRKPCDKCGEQPANPIRYRRAICDAAKRFGIAVLQWMRKSDGSERMIQMDTTNGRLVRN